jgi:hypothetical protein
MGICVVFCLAERTQESLTNKRSVTWKEREKQSAISVCGDASRFPNQKGLERLDLALSLVILSLPVGLDRYLKQAKYSRDKPQTASPRTAKDEASYSIANFVYASLCRRGAPEFCPFCHIHDSVPPSHAQILNLQLPSNQLAIFTFPLFLFQW